ncbi:MAG: hypothetical protein QE271_03290 [Bacteriovoracaceae bacterium]|nr:hypothetical protein [Bacteriovoracaceae bacterium]
MAESISTIIIGWVYYKVRALRTAKWVLSIPLFCTAPLVIIFWQSSAYIFYGCFLVYGLIYLYGFTRYRDDLFMAGKDLKQRIHHSAFHLMLTNFLRTISAPIVALLVSYEIQQMGKTPLRYIISIQIFMGLIAIIFLRFKSASK